MRLLKRPEDLLVLLFASSVWRAVSPVAVESEPKPSLEVMSETLSEVGEEGKAGLERMGLDLAALALVD